eukprot:CAMPEP_0202979326 /NCGR_PEP_ID=MMETSP1396-20130829/85511_1 /ASSEMBLY_ACC=CAM_ASM_000872 /TAXON_ID= /ORGANISM="Pseudokeronopsis sp., Strain Brazil" /LENGTH=75 /DNA_ID=CAMNT_0049718709 /DNA_START=1714 /DNA_END=1941 /DNA_ORIENTATION=-
MEERLKKERESPVKDKDLKEEESLREKLKGLREENLQLVQRVKDLELVNDSMERNLVDAKMNWADLDMENEDLAF